MPQPSSPNLPGTRPLASLLHILAVAAAMLSMGVCPAEEPEKDPALEPYFIANGAYNRKLYPVAITQYEVFLAKHPDHVKADLARQGLALSQYALKQYEKALPQLTILLAKEKLDQQINRERIIMLKLSLIHI